MKEKVKLYFSRVGSLISQACNTLFLFGHNDESISARTYRTAQGGSPFAKKAEKVINFLFRPLEKDHCKRAFETDMARAEELIRDWAKGDK